MADTRNDVQIPAKTWVNLYTSSGISVGTAVTVYNKGSAPLNLAVKATVPLSSTLGYPVAVFPNSMSFAAVPASQTGLWAYSEIGTIVLVQE